MKKLEKIRINWGTAFFVILLAVQCLYMIYWGTQKGGYYVDEFFTYDNAHYISASTPSRVKLYDADYMEYNKWFPVSELKSTLTVQQEEALFHDSFSYNLNRLVQGNGNSYSSILHYVEAIFFEGELNWWSAISLNILFYIGTQILLYALVLRISSRQSSALLSMAMYGFCGMAVSMMVYVRFYMYAIMLLTLFTYLHVRMWESCDHKKNILWEVLSLPVLYLAFDVSPLCAGYGGAMIICFTIGLIISRRWLQAAYYAIPILGGGGIYAFFMTDYIDIFLNPQSSLDSGKLSAAASSLTQNLATLNLQSLGGRIVDFSHIVCRYLFGHAVIVAAYLVIFVTAVLLYIRERHQSIRNSSRVVSEDAGHHGMEAMTYILTGTVLIYAMLSVALALTSIRYNSFIFPELAACSVLLITMWGKERQSRWIITGILSVAIVGEVFFTCSIPRIQNLYREDKQGVQAIREHSGIDSVVVDYKWDDKVMYECLAYTDENTQVMFVTDQDADYKGLKRDTILLWQTVNRGFDVMDDLLEAGYTGIEEIGRTHESVVYLVWR
ncbi:MAG: hypothetical protein K2N44_01015 [Lachnospiraceae bacterium]|nr:hypothetical protein [Lachnospiraceae bacterium]